jgi:hypothetical protein
LRVPAHGSGIVGGHSQIHAENVPATAPAADCGTARLVRGPAASPIGLYLREYGNSMLVFVIRTSRARL